jgi:hypothetical protein
MRLSTFSTAGAVTALFAAGLAAAFMTVDHATAVDAQKPVPCEGVQVLTDAAGDANYKALLGNGSGPNQTAMDITKAWIQVRGAEVTVNIQVNDFSTANRNQRWSSFFKSGGKDYEIYAIHFTNDMAPAVTPPTNFLYSVNGAAGKATTGKVFGTKDAVIQIVVPDEVGLKADSTITNVRFQTQQFEPNDLLPESDALMDDPLKTISSYAVKGCSASTAGSSSAATTTDSSTQATNTAATTTDASTQGMTTGGTTSGGTTTSGDAGSRGSQSAGPRALKLRFTRFGGSAKKLSLKRAIVLRVRTTGGRLTRLRAVLRFRSFHGPIVARGSLAALEGRGTITLRRTRKLKTGLYYLVVVGFDAQRRPGVATALARFS